MPHAYSDPSSELSPHVSGTLSSFLDIRPHHLIHAWKLIAAEHGGYTSFDVVRGGRHRVIVTPVPLLRALQQRILARLLKPGPVSPAAFAGVIGRSQVTAARCHVGSRQLLRLDVADAFASTRYFQVAAAFRQRIKTEMYLAGLNRAERNEIAGVLAHCVLAPLGDTAGRLGVRARSLPLGAPTSVAVFNRVMQPVDIAIAQEIAGLGLPPGEIRYTRYVDDMAFSTPGTLPAEPIERAVAHHLRAQKFLVRRSKRTFFEAPPFDLHGLEIGIDGIGIAPGRRDDLAERTKVLRASIADAAVSTEVQRRARDELRGIEAYVRYVYADSPPETLRPHAGDHRTEERRPILTVDDWWS